MTYYWSFKKSRTSGVVGWVGTVYPFVIVNDDVVLSFYFSAANVLHYQIMHTFLLHIHNNRYTLVFNRCKCLTYLWTFAILELNVLTTYVKLERIWFLTRKNICYGVLSPFASISMPYRHSLNKKQ
jgi:hypothetical protein